ncbi:MAG: tRNA (adenosine(37)-N6)-dimethylallyltransferase MiaA [Lachnoclostridium sp.]|nr:tRNA (adenosine(37)-N6)-dimethylallyltransferase MiaA [Lachnoclostridium sp.]
MENKTLVIITGPTASGKSALAVEVAERLGCDIISADSRQIYKGLPIGTASPSQAELMAVRHHFVGTLDLHDYFSAALFEEEVMRLLPQLWADNDYAVMCGGSMMYIDAVTRGIDSLPTISPAVRDEALALFKSGGREAVISRLQELDPEYLRNADLNNHKRLVHALEICLEAGVPCSSLLTGKAVKRPFRIVKMAIDWPRPELFARINERVDRMISLGLEREARSVYHLRHLNSLNTVGYKEMFAMFDGVMDRQTAIARIAKNTRVYAKKQLLWLSKDPSVHLLSPGPAMADEAISIIQAR